MGSVFVLAWAKHLTTDILIISKVLMDSEKKKSIATCIQKRWTFLSIPYWLAQ